VQFYVAWVTQNMADKQYRYVNLPSALADAIESYVAKTKKYTTMASFVQEACRLRLEQIAKEQ